MGIELRATQAMRICFAKSSNVAHKPPYLSIRKALMWWVKRSWQLPSSICKSECMSSEVRSLTELRFGWYTAQWSQSTYLLANCWHEEDSSISILTLPSQMPTYLILLSFSDRRVWGSLRPWSQDTCGCELRHIILRQISPLISQLLPLNWLHILARPMHRLRTSIAQPKDLLTTCSRHTDRTQCGTWMPQKLKAEGPSVGLPQQISSISPGLFSNPHTRLWIHSCCSSRNV